MRDWSKKARTFSAPSLKMRSMAHGNGARQMFERCIRFFWRDKRPVSEQARDRAFIAALNKLETLRVTPEGGMSIDPDEIRDTRYESESPVTQAFRAVTACDLLAVLSRAAGSKER